MDSKSKYKQDHFLKLYLLLQVHGSVDQ